MNKLKFSLLAFVVALLVILVVIAKYSDSFQAHLHFRDTTRKEAPNCDPLTETYRRNQINISQSPCEQCPGGMMRAESNVSESSYNQPHGVSGATQAERQFTIRRACSKDKLAHISLPCPFQVIDKYSLLAGIMAKCGGTTWNRLLLSLLGFHNATEDIESRPINEILHKKVHGMKGLAKGKLSYIMENYKRIVIVRNPFIRLLSGFRDRLERFPNQFMSQRNNYNKKIYTKYEYHTQEEKPDDAVPSGLYNVSFKGFVSFYLAGNDEDPHFKEQHKKCHPCTGFDYIGKVETYDQDIVEILKLINVDPVVYQNKASNPTNSRSDETLARYYQTLSDEQFTALTKKFQNDLIYFGYTIPEAIRRPHLSLR